MMFDKDQPPTFLVPQMNAHNTNGLLPAMFPISMAPILIPAPPGISINTTLTSGTVPFPTNVTAIPLPSLGTTTHIKPVPTLATNLTGNTASTGHLSIHTPASLSIPNHSGFFSPFIPINLTVQPQLFNVTAPQGIFIKSEPAEVPPPAITNGHQTSNTHDSVKIHTQIPENGLEPAGNLDEKTISEGKDKLQELVQMFDQTYTKSEHTSLVKSEPSDCSTCSQSLDDEDDISTREIKSNEMSVVSNPQVHNAPSLNGLTQSVMTSVNVSPSNQGNDFLSTGTSATNMNTVNGDAPDTSALTTLAIVCDNFGTGRDNQYVVKVQLEESSAPFPTHSKVQKTKNSKAGKESVKTQGHTEHVRNRVPVARHVSLAELALASSTSEEEVDVSRLSDEDYIPPKSATVSVKLSHVESYNTRDSSHCNRKKRLKKVNSTVKAKHDNSELSTNKTNSCSSKKVATNSCSGKKVATNSCSGKKVATNSCSGKKRKRKDDTDSTMKGKATEGEQSTLRRRKYSHRKIHYHKNELEKRLKRKRKSSDNQSSSTPTLHSPGQTSSGSLDEILKKLNNTTETSNADQTQAIANMSPASTIPYGEDSNDSVDLTGRSMYQCTECIKSYTSERRLRLHIGLIHEESDKSPLSSIFSCRLCTKAYTSQKRLDLHMLLVHEKHSKYAPPLPAAPLPPGSSSYSTNSSSRKLVPNVDIKVEDNSSDCESNSGNTESESTTCQSANGSSCSNTLAQTTVTDTSNIHPNSCTLCGKKYSTPVRLNLHINLIHGSGKFSHSNLKSLHINKKIKKEPHSESHTTSAEHAISKVKIKKEPVDTEEEPVRPKRPHFYCSGCSLIFTDKRLYNDHLPMHDTEKKFTPKKINNRTYIKKYYLVPAEQSERIMCKLCKGDFHDERSAANHVRNVHGIYDAKDQRLPCRYCGKIFTRKQFLLRHLNVHSGIRPVDTQVKKYKCTYCSKTFSQKAHVERHVQLMHMDSDLVRIFKCDICGNSYKLKSHLKRHIQLHEGTLPFRCNICPMACADRNSLRIHFRVHTGERPYSCQHCDHAFSFKYNLNNHIITMHPEQLDAKTRRKHQCMICGKVCNKGSLKVHLKSHDTQRNYQCEKCPKTFKTIVTKQSHMMSVHKLPRYFCEICGKTCKSRHAFNKHMEKH